MTALQNIDAKSLVPEIVNVEVASAFITVFVTNRCVIKNLSALLVAQMP